MNAQWVQCNGPTGGTVTTLAISNNASGEFDIYTGSDRGGIRISTNKGKSWKAVNNGLTATDINGIAIN